MPNRRLTDDELSTLFRPLFDEVKNRLKELAGDDQDLHWALRRKLFKELTYEERSKPMQRKLLKAKKIGEQGGKCAICGNTLPEFGAVLDRFEAMKGYITDNVRVLCSTCDTAEQQSRGYA